VEVVGRHFAAEKEPRLVVVGHRQHLQKEVQRIRRHARRRRVHRLAGASAGAAIAQIEGLDHQVVVARHQAQHFVDAAAAQHAVAEQFVHGLLDQASSFETEVGAAGDAPRAATSFGARAAASRRAPETRASSPAACSSCSTAPLARN
jgi:hypothetical protein